MIVIAIIGILAAIAIPNFIAYRKKAQIGKTVQRLPGGDKPRRYIIEKP